MTWYRRLVAVFADHERLLERVASLERSARCDYQRIVSLERRAATYSRDRDAYEARDFLLRDEIEKWKSHRAWSDQIVRAYLDEIERKTAVLQ